MYTLQSNLIVHDAVLVCKAPPIFQTFFEKTDFFWGGGARKKNSSG
jgi:hypothetical protein